MIEYTIASGNDPEKVAILVSKLLQQGYVLQGGISITNDGNGYGCQGIYYAQALLKIKETDILKKV